MGQLPQLQQARRLLGLALDGLCHDRWVLGYLRSGWLQPIAASEVSRRFLQGRPLMPLARRALYVRAHWLRMPPLLLAWHLGVKAVRRQEEPAA